MCTPRAVAAEQPFELVGLAGLGLLVVVVVRSKGFLRRACNSSA